MYWLNRILCRHERLKGDFLFKRGDRFKTKESPVPFMVDNDMGLMLYDGGMVIGNGHWLADHAGIKCRAYRITFDPAGWPTRYNNLTGGKPERFLAPMDDGGMYEPEVTMYERFMVPA